MFDSITGKQPGRRKRRWIAFVLGSAVVNAGLLAGAYFLIPRDAASHAAVEVPVAFAPKAEPAAVEEAAPPPPPPPPVARAPVASTGGKRVRRALEAPTRIPDAPPSRVDPVRPPGSETGGGTGNGVGPGAVAALEPPAPAAPPARKLVQWNEKMDAPVAEPGNPVPEYPEAARRAGLEGMVEAKIAVDESGATTVLGVRKGQEPFVSAVVSVLPSWRFRPARLDGAPVPVARIVRVPFRLHR